MPLYSFRDTATNEEFELTMFMSEREPYLEANPHIVQTVTKVSLARGSGIGDSNKPSKDFRNLLTKIKKEHRGSTINDF